MSEHVWDRGAGRVSPHTAAWIAWSVWALSMALFMLIVLIPTRGEKSLAVIVPFAAFVVGFATAGALIAAHRPENPIGWIMCSVVPLFELGAVAQQYAEYALLMRPGSLPGGVAMAWLSSWIWAPGLGLFAFLLLLFPDGRLPSRRWRPVAWFNVTVLAVTAVSVAFSPGEIENLGPVKNPLGIERAAGVLNLPARVFFSLLAMLLLVSTVSLLLRLRHARGDERQQIKWFAYAAALLASDAVALMTFGAGIGSWVGFALFAVGLLAVPAAVGIAIFRYRLYDIDIVINRTLVYGALTACVIAIYVLVVSGLGALLQARSNLLISLLATGLVAVMFAPLRDRLQRGVNRLMYGERDEPYAVLSRLGKRLEDTLTPGHALPAMVETVAQALRLPYAAISLKRGERFETVAEYGAPAGEPLVLPLTYGLETVGRLVLSPRAPGEPFTKSDLRLLEDLARQVGIAAHAMRLTTDLQRSRERLVTAREEERRRLRRELHDGIGPQLAALTLKIETARNRLSQDPAADALLSDLAGRARTAVADVRRSVHALRPPALDELGLVPALRETATQYTQGGLRVSVEAPEDLPPLPAAVEVAAYRVAQEAMTNTVRHAEASSCTVRLGLDEEAGLLRLEVEDDGRGVGENRGTGVGLSSMRERAEELGGTCVVEPRPACGTRVRALLPYGETH